MIDSKGSVIVRGQGSHDRLSGAPVVPDRGGQGKDALQDPHGYTGDGPATVLLKIQLALEGLVDRFDALPYSTKQAATGVTTAFPWSSELDNTENRTFVAEFKKAYTDDATGQPLAPDGYASEMWSAMRVLDAALTATKGETKDAGRLVSALEAVSVAGPGGTITFDASTHNVIQDEYVREVRSSAGGLVNAVVDTIASVKDPGR